MRFTGKLALFLQQKTVKDPGWYVREYKQAVKRIEDHSADKENPYWHAPNAQLDALPTDNMVHDETGSSRTIKEARQEAMETIVLCDVWEANQK